MKEGVGGLNAFDQLDLMAAEVPAGSDGLIALPHLQDLVLRINANARTLFWHDHRSRQGTFCASDHGECCDGALQDH